jgi:transposase
MHFIEPADRNQIIFMNKLDDIVSSDNIVRVLDDLVDSIIKKTPTLYIDKGQFSIGRKAYSPALFIKLYIYGYFNGINSSRKLEKEAQRNIELIWLLGTLTPDFKTIADYRKDNGDKIERVLQQFVSFLKSQGYIEGRTVSLDGTKVRANAQQVMKIEGLDSKLQNLSNQLREYLEALDRNDAEDEYRNSGEREALLKKINDLEKKIQSLEQAKEFMDSNDLKQYSPTDPESRIMKGREGKHFSYNVQATVDEKLKMIVTTEVTSDENDKNQLCPAVEKLLENKIAPENLLADTGYHKTKAIQNTESKGITCYIPINENKSTLHDKKSGLSFQYNQQEDHYICGQGQILNPKQKQKVDHRRETVMTSYEAEECNTCSQKIECCPDKNKRVKWRHVDQQWRDEYEVKLKTQIAQSFIKKRKELSEHPFGTIKHWMGKIPLKLRGKIKVQTEINLYHIAYNFKRLVNSVSTGQLVNQISEYNWRTA